MMQYFKAELPRIRQILEAGRYFLVLTHLDPDGDALGAAFGLAAILKKMKKVPLVGLNQPAPKRFEFITNEGGIKAVYPDKYSLAKFAAVFIVDTSTVPRLDQYSGILAAIREQGLAIPVVNIDHHPDNQRFGDVNIIDPQASSASQLILELFGSRALDAYSAFCIYTGIVADTGSFRHGTDMKRAHQAAGTCLTWPIDTKFVYDQLFAIETEGSLKLFSRALARLAVLEKGKLAAMHLTHEDYRELRLTGEDSAGFINRMLLIEGAQVLVFFNETEKNVVKISLRSNSDCHVGELAAKFGGGGHAKASGCIQEGPLDRVMDRVLKSVRLVLEQPVRNE